jgi:hypothetical protein
LTPLGGFAVGSAVEVLSIVGFVSDEVLCAREILFSWVVLWRPLLYALMRVF